MKGQMIIIGFVLVLLFMTCILPPVVAETESTDEKDKMKDSDKDGIPDYLDNNSTRPSTNNTKKTNKSQEESSGRSGGGNWSFEYGSDPEYGAWIGDVNWNSSYYIKKANVPWIKIDNVKYIIPEDFTEEGTGDMEYTNYYLAYQLYSINISGIDHDVELLWYFYKATAVNNTGKINMTVLHSAHDNNPHSIFVPVRIDFDILGNYDDYFQVYGSPGWHCQTTEAYQSTSTPVDPTWGMKVRQHDNNIISWGGIKAWSTNEKNYLLLYHDNEYKGDPDDYLTGENTNQEDDVLWTTAGITACSALSCGPILYLH